MSSKTASGETTLASAKTPLGYAARLAEFAARHEHAAWVVAIVALLLDALTTAYGFEVGLTEANPIVNGLLPTLGFFTTFAVLKGFALAVGALCWFVLPREYRSLVPVGLAFPWVTAVAMNTITISSVYL